MKASHVKHSSLLTSGLQSSADLNLVRDDDVDSEDTVLQSNDDKWFRMS